MASGSTISSERCFQICQHHQQMFLATDWNDFQNNINMHHNSGIVSLNNFLLVHSWCATPPWAAFRPILPRIVEILADAPLDTSSSNGRRTADADLAFWCMQSSGPSSIGGTIPLFRVYSFVLQSTFPSWATGTPESRCGVSCHVVGSYYSITSMSSFKIVKWSEIYVTS